MIKCVDKSGYWLAHLEIEATHPDVLVNGMSFSDEVEIRIRKNQWGVPVYELNPYIRDKSEMPPGYLFKVRRAPIPGLPADFGPWVPRRLFESSGPFLKGHVYGMQSLWPYGRDGKNPAHIPRLILEFEGVNEEDMDTFRVLEDQSKSIDTDPSTAPPLRDLKGTQVGYQHSSPREVLEDPGETRRYWYIGTASEFKTKS